MGTETKYILKYIFILFQIARVQPMVPEVSVFSQTSNSGGSRRPLRTVNNFEKSVEDSLGRTIPSKKAPMPHQPPIRGEFRTSSDISKLVNSLVRGQLELRIPCLLFCARTISCLWNRRSILCRFWSYQNFQTSPIP